MLISIILALEAALLIIMGILLYGADLMPLAMLCWILAVFFILEMLDK